MATLKEQFSNWIEQNQLLYLKLFKSKDGKKVVLGRILKYDENQGHLLMYLDDEKMTFHITLNEIEDITPAIIKTY